MPARLSTPIRPPIASTRRLQIARPSPEPPNRRRTDPSAWANGRKRIACCRGGNADAGVADLEAQPDRPRRRREPGHRDRDAPLLGELERVAYKVEQHLAQAGGIALDRRQEVTGKLEGEDKAAFDRLRVQDRPDLLDQARDIEVGRLELDGPGLDPGDVKHIVDDRQELSAGGADGTQMTRRVRRQVVAGEKVGHAQDRGHRRPDLVAHGGKEL